MPDIVYVTGHSLSPIFEGKDNFLSFLVIATKEMDSKSNFNGTIEMILEAMQELILVFGDKLGLHLVKIKVCSFLIHLFSFFSNIFSAISGSSC